MAVRASCASTRSHLGSQSISRPKNRSNRYNRQELAIRVGLGTKSGNLLLTLQIFTDREINSMIRQIQTMMTITTHMESNPRWIWHRIHGMRRRWKGKFQTYTSQPPKVATITLTTRTKIIFTLSKSWTWINMAGACKGIPKKRLISQMRDIREVQRDGRHPYLVEEINWMRRVHISNTKPLRSR